MKRFLRSLGFTLLCVFSFTNCSFVDRLGGESDVLIVPFGEGEQRSGHEAWGKQFMVVTQGPYSSMAGEQMFKKGGNVFDAAAAVTFTISVERPQSTGIGGGGFAMVRRVAEEVEYHAVDFREKAPIASHRDMFLDDQGVADPNLSRQGPLSVGVPGMVAGILELHQKYGNLPLKDVLAPATVLARNGFPVYPELRFALERSREKLEQFEESVNIFFNDKGEPLEVGDILVQSDLAQTLQRIAEHGHAGFYSGETAKSIIRSIQDYGGILGQKDLDSYNVVWRSPVVGSFLGREVISMPPPSSGGAHIVQILNTIENDSLGKFGIHDARSIHLIASAMQQAFADRAKYMGDSDFVDVPLEKIMSKTYAQEIRRNIPDRQARSVEEVTPFELKDKIVEPDHTTHFVVADAEGNIVSSTQTINGFFGSGMVAKGTGVVLNNEMDDFTAQVGASNLFGAIGGEPNIVEPHKRPLSSMSPTIVIENDRPLLALGSPSGTRILTCVASTILNVLMYDLDLYTAVSAVRYHHQWRPDQIRVDRPGFSPETTRLLESWGHTVNVQDLGCRIQAVHYLNDGRIHGVSDIRGQGMSRGE